MASSQHPPHSREGSPPAAAASAAPGADTLHADPSHADPSQSEADFAQAHAEQVARRDARRSAHRKAQRMVQVGVLLNALLAVVKLVAGLLGNAYALVADAIESATDMIGSLVVWSGLRIASRDPDERYPFGYGRAEALAGAAVAALMLGAAAGITVEAISEIVTPHHAPAPWTLVVLVVVIVLKEWLAKRLSSAGDASGSVAVEADAWHHRADAISSGAAFIGISTALIGGEGWEVADDWAALVAAALIAFNGYTILRRSLRELMDRAPEVAVQDTIRNAALGTSGVRDVEKLMVRKSGTSYYVDIHVQADPHMTLHDAHILSGRVKGSIRLALPSAAGVLVHMEPYEPRLTSVSDAETTLSADLPSEPTNG